MNKIFHGDSLEVLKELENDSVDVLVTDPPYGYSFMGKAWDKALPDIGIFKECLRVLKPGAFAFVMSAPRSDVCSRMAILLEDAGFRIDFSPLAWCYASGFPKAYNVGKKTGNAELRGAYGGFQPKPAWENIIVAMKPLSEKTYVDQALKNGKGITWLDDCRVPFQGDYRTPYKADGTQGGSRTDGIVGQGFRGASVTEDTTREQQGRFPANLLVSDDVLNDGVERKSGKAVVGSGGKGASNFMPNSKVYSCFADSGSYSRYFDLDAWAKTLPFLITPKASKSEKNAGVEGGNIHPTCKPLKLMSYLITLGSREGDVVLDPFTGSGTTCLAAKNLKRNYIGIEREAEYVEIAEARLKEVQPTLL